MIYITLFSFLLWILHVHANVEKVIFVAPGPEPTPDDASIDNLLLTPLSETFPSVRTYINASFPTNTSAKGTESWFLLDGLSPHRRYEVRICWLATQPTSFWLYTHLVDSVFLNVDLISSLSQYSYLRHAQLNEKDIKALQARKANRPNNEDSTFLFLQVFAAADYFSLNQTLMEVVPPVAVDIILDPYVLNILPRSLIPTGLYLIAIALIAWFLSARVARFLTAPTGDAAGKTTTKKSQ